MELLQPYLSMEDFTLESAKKVKKLITKIKIISFLLLLFFFIFCDFITVMILINVNILFINIIITNNKGVW